MKRDSLNTTVITNPVNNTSFERSSASEHVLPKLDEKLLRDLQQKREKLEQKIEAKEQEKTKSVNEFVSGLQKELRELKDKDYKKEDGFKQEIAKFGENHKRILTEIIESTKRLELSKDNFIDYLKQEKAKRHTGVQKNRPNESYMGRA